MEIYRDPVTGYEIRRYTNGPERNAKLYFTCENFSVDDKYFFFMKQQLEGKTDGGCYRANVKTGEIDRVTDYSFRGFATDRERISAIPAKMRRKSMPWISPRMK